MQENMFMFDDIIWSHELTPDAKVKFMHQKKKKEKKKKAENGRLLSGSSGDEFLRSNNVNELRFSPAQDTSSSHEY